MAGIYIHIPFCYTKCLYCDFYSVIANSERETAFIAALTQEIIARKNEINEEIKTIYFGGGTPNTLTSLQLRDILHSIFEHYSVQNQAEISIELNPYKLDRNYINALKKAEFNRISLGIQSIYDEDLVYLGRKHRGKDVFHCLQEILESDISNYSVDLIFGLHNQESEKSIQGIEKIIAYQPSHFSIYALSVEENTALQELVSKGKRLLLSEDEQEKIYTSISGFLQKKGFNHYEISSYALPGKESKHNSAYWFGETYLGFGPSAHSYHSKARYWNLSDLKMYIQQPLRKEKEELSAKSIFNEKIMLGLRTAAGLYLEELKEYHSPFYRIFEKELIKLIRQAYIVKEDNRIRIPYEHWFRSDYIISSLFIA